jgi:hypothetical protein
MSKKPVGFHAVCQCGRIVGAMDFDRTDRAEASSILSKWLMHGCTIVPQLKHGWSVFVEPCQCKKESNND